MSTQTSEEIQQQILASTPQPSITAKQLETSSIESNDKPEQEPTLTEKKQELHGGESSRFEKAKVR